MPTFPIFKETYQRFARASEVAREFARKFQISVKIERCEKGGWTVYIPRDQTNEEVDQNAVIEDGYRYEHDGYNYDGEPEYDPDDPPLERDREVHF